MIHLLCIAIGGCAGAILRYLTGELIKKLHATAFPLGTLIINLIGSFLLGLLIGNETDGEIYKLLGIGFMGAYTTFSTFQLETIQLLAAKMKKKALIYLMSTYAGGMILAYLGLLLGRI